MRTVVLCKGPQLYIILNNGELTIYPKKQNEIRVV